jgi:hypothetical protein
MYPAHGVEVQTHARINSDPLYDPIIDPEMVRVIVALVAPPTPRVSSFNRGSWERT